MWCGVWVGSCGSGWASGFVHPLGHLVDLWYVRSALRVGTDATGHQLSQLWVRSGRERACSGTSDNFAIPRSEVKVWARTNCAIILFRGLRCHFTKWQVLEHDVWVCMNIPLLSICQQEGEGSRTSQSSYTENRGSSCPHRMETGELPSTVQWNPSNQDINETQ